MRVLHVLTYYRPWISGLTIYVERLARGLAQSGHTVTVLTAQYEDTLPIEETVDGVRVVRAPVAARVSKGVIMPGFGRRLRALLPGHDLVHLHLPQFDGAGIAINAVGAAEKFTRKQIDELAEVVKRYGGKGCAWVKVEAEKFTGGVEKFLAPPIQQMLRERLGAKAGDLLLFHSHTIHAARPNITENHLRISVDYRYQGVSQPVVPDSLEPHYGRLTWDDIYMCWTSDLPYYWRDLPLNIVQRDFRKQTPGG